VSRVWPPFNEWQASEGVVRADRRRKLERLGGRSVTPVLGLSADERRFVG
jgi:hypothetical protein